MFFSTACSLFKVWDNKVGRNRKKAEILRNPKDSSKNCQYGNIGFGQTSNPSKIGQASLL